MFSLNTLLLVLIVIHTSLAFLDGVVTFWEVIGSLLFDCLIFYIAMIYDTWPPETTSI